MNLRHYHLVLAILSLLVILSQTATSQTHDIVISDETIVLSASGFQKNLKLQGTNLLPDAFILDGQTFQPKDSFEISFKLSKALPNVQPLGILDDENDMIQQKASIANQTDALDVSGEKSQDVNASVQWVDARTLCADNWDMVFRKVHATVSVPEPGTKRLNLRFASLDDADFPDLTVNIFFEVYEGHAAIRKWVEITNNSSQWLKIDDLILDGWAPRANFSVATDLTPVERGATSSIRSYSNEDYSQGIITGSEIPSAVRVIYDDGRMGYAQDYFEWVLGPTERFVSEPVFHYAFNGKTHLTASAVSTGLDRTIERPFRHFLNDCVGLKKVDASRFTPLWCTWTNFMSRVDEHSIAEMAELAARCGFRGFLIDAGWGTSFSNVFAPASIIPDEKKFPDFGKTADHITSLGLSMGLWVSCFRHPEFDPDLKAVPGGYSLPKIKRDEGLAMSYASKWRYYYANNLMKLRDQFGVTYFKQDFTNIQFGDIARSHESRTLKESYLRALRGLLESADRITHAAPDVVVELTHEIYWGTPGVPCDIAALKHAHTYHIPPNDYSGAGNRGERVNEQWGKNENYSPEKLRAGLLQGCINARNRFYAHRALPLDRLEYYGAATVNFQESLTSQVQQRQICSWLMGAPSVYAGDLASLSDENIETYRNAFDILQSFHQKYGIYRHFQYSGVPAPTDEGWHWWGKLNEQGNGVLVVMRGSQGPESQKINVPWVLPEKEYRLRACFSNQDLGTFPGQKLMNGDLILPLPAWGQEIIEVYESTDDSASEKK